MNKQETGKLGEELAVKFLKKKDYIVLECNWRFKHKEIDIIAKHPDGDFRIVEVKTRANDVFQRPSDTISISKQEFLIEAAAAYIEQNHVETDVYFDLITIYLNNNKPEIIHIENCFTP
jgi:putative endonuclease